MADMKTGPTRPGKSNAKRQPYVLAACSRCKKRKIRCSGHSPCAQCAKRGARGASACVYDRLVPLPAALPIPFPPLLLAATPEVVASGESFLRAESWKGEEDGGDGALLRPLGRRAALALLDGFEEDVVTLYPFVELREMRRLVREALGGARTEVSGPTASWGGAGEGAGEGSSRLDGESLRWDDGSDGRSVEFLKLLLACAIAARNGGDGEDGEVEVARKWVGDVEEQHFRRTRGAEVDLKDLAIAMMLGVYQYYCDNARLACRKMAAAARLSLELGLNRPPDPIVDGDGLYYQSCASKLFWCIYVLDRRYSFMFNLSFTFKDRDVDFRRLQPDKSAPYLFPLVVYSRLAGQIIPAVRQHGVWNASGGDLSDDKRAGFGLEIDSWVTDMIIQSSNNSFAAATSVHQPPNSHLDLQTFVQIRGNYLRLCLYRDSLCTPFHAARYAPFAHVAVNAAISNIRVLTTLRRASSRAYDAYSTHHKHFLVRSLVTLYLAISNAPNQFAATIQEYTEGVGLLEAGLGDLSKANAPVKMRKSVQELKKAIGLLYLGPINVRGHRIFPQPRYMPADESFLPVVGAASGTYPAGLGAVERWSHAGRNTSQHPPIAMNATVAAPTFSNIENSSVIHEWDGLYSPIPTTKYAPVVDGGGHVDVGINSGGPAGLEDREVEERWDEWLALDSEKVQSVEMGMTMGIGTNVGTNMGSGI